jgi:hypothetical protein
MVRPHRGALVLCLFSVALALFALASGVDSPASPSATVARGRAPYPKPCRLGTEPGIGGNCLLDEAFEPCPSVSGAGCAPVGGGVVGRPIASHFTITVSPSVVAVGETLNVTLTSALPPCTADMVAKGTLCWYQAFLGDPRRVARYLPLGYNSEFNPPILRFDPSCSAPEGPSSQPQGPLPRFPTRLTCTATVLAPFGPQQLLTDHYMIVGATINISGSGITNAGGDFLETAVGLSNHRMTPAGRLTIGRIAFDVDSYNLAPQPGRADRLLTVIKDLDATSPGIAEDLRKSTVFATARLDVYKPGTRHVSSSFTFRRVEMLNYSVEGSSAPTETVTLDAFIKSFTRHR